METYRYIIFDVGMDPTEILPKSHLPHPSVPPETAGESLAEPAALDNAETEAVELVVLGADVEPALDPLPKAAPDMRHEDGAVLVGETRRAGDPHVYTVGDISAWRDKAQPGYAGVTELDLEVEHKKE